MSLVSLLFSFNGRVNRVQYWIGSLGVGFAGIIAMFALGLALSPAPGASPEAALRAAPLMLIMMGLICLVMGWAGLAIQVKRFHDRNQPGWLCLLPLLPMFGLMLAVAGSVAAGHTPEQMIAGAQPYVLVLWAINFFFFINLGCLGGTDGPNKYGNPPGSPGSPSSDPLKPSRQPAQAAFSLGSAEAAMERAIAEKSRAAPAPAPTRPAQVAVAAAAAGAPASFGRRRTR